MSVLLYLLCNVVLNEVFLNVDSYADQLSIPIWVTMNI
jgi:hypothetical protein